MTGQEMCEVISRFLKEAEGIEMTPMEIWNASPTGELWHVFALYEDAKAWFKENPE